MTGHLVIAELDAFRTVIANAGFGDHEKIKLWSRSAISNALHRAGPQLRDAAFRASQQADRLAEVLSGSPDAGAALALVRSQASDALRDLIAEVRAAG